MTNTNEENISHQQRMQRKKAVIDARVNNATIERGVVILLKGTGKGKSSSAFGTAVRALGHGMRVGIIQFIKGKRETGERLFLHNIENVEYYLMGTGFTWETQNKQIDIAAAKAAWEQARIMLSNDNLDLILLDEITYMFKYGYLPLNDVIESIQQRPQQQSVILTGRTAPAEIEQIADTVSEVRNIKHAFGAGIKGQKGIEW